jgi:hypothetical protein
MRLPVRRLVARRSGRFSTCSTRARSSTRPGGPFTSGSPSGGRIYLDLADDCWRAVEIGPDGWQVMGCPRVRFRRTPGMLPLPIPERGGSVEALAPFLNLADRSDFVLAVVWLMATLRHGGPYPLLAVSGEQGSATRAMRCGRDCRS